MIRLLTFILLITCASKAAEHRTWKSSKGDTIQATFIKEDSGVVYLKSASKKTITIKRESLSQEDISFLDNLPKPMEDDIRISILSAKVKCSLPGNSGLYAIFANLDYTIRTKEPRITRPLAVFTILTEDSSGVRRLMFAHSVSIDGKNYFRKSAGSSRDRFPEQPEINVNDYANGGRVSISSNGEVKLNVGMKKKQIICYKVDIYIEDKVVATYESREVSSLLSRKTIPDDWYKTGTYSEKFY